MSSILERYQQLDEQIQQAQQEQRRIVTERWCHVLETVFPGITVATFEPELSQSETYIVPPVPDTFWIGEQYREAPMVMLETEEQLDALLDEDNLFNLINQQFASYAEIRVFIRDHKVTTKEAV